MACKQGHQAGVRAVGGKRVSAWFLGQANHPDFREIIELLDNDTQLTLAPSDRHATSRDAAGVFSPELIVIAQARPGQFRWNEVDRWRCRFPLAGVVSLLGSWCEGELRTGRPLPGAERLYWHEFHAWWHRQTLLRSTGHCPDWACTYAPSQTGRLWSPLFPAGELAHRGLIVLGTPRWDTADALADVLLDAGFASAWLPPGKPVPPMRGVVAGIWEGGQLDDAEAQQLAAFSQRLARDTAPVVALLDFPRRDCVDRAFDSGAAAVLGKPWINSELIATLRPSEAD